MTYTLLPPPITAILRDADGATIPADLANGDWQAYQAWLAGGHSPSPAVAPPIGALLDHAAQAWQAMLARGRSINVAVSGGPPMLILCDGTNATRADLALLAMFGQQNPTGTKTWLDNNGVATALTGAELVTLATLAGNWVAATYPALAALVDGINASPATITSKAQIDAFAWPSA